MATVTRSDVNLSDSPTTDDLVQAVNQLASEVESLREDKRELQDELSSVREELADVRDRAGQDRAELSRRVTELESPDDAEMEPSDPTDVDETPGGQTPEDGEDGPTETLPSPKTALEDTLRLPDTVADESLTANQRRARDVARGIDEFAEYNASYGNYSLTAKRLKIVLKSHSDSGRVHHETISRVRSFLEQMGESEVSVVEDRGGTKRLVFAKSLVDRIKAHVEATHAVVRADGTDGGVGV